MAIKTTWISQRAVNRVNDAMAIEHETFKQRLRDLRLRRGLTQDEAARAIGVHSRGYQFWEQGRHIPGLKSLEKIAAAFNVSTEYFMEPAELPEADRELRRQLGEINQRLANIERLLEQRD